MDVDNPYLKIDEAFSAEAQAASLKHEQDAAPLNEQLGKDLEAAFTQEERDEIMARFAEDVAPVQDAYNKEIEKARTKCEKAKAKAATAYEKFLTDEEEATQAQADAKEAERQNWNEQLKGRLEAGEATPAEVQKILASLIDVPTN